MARTQSCRVHTVAELVCALDAKFRQETDAAKAEALGASSSSLRAWRRGEEVPTARYGVALARAIGIDPEYVHACLSLARSGDTEAAVGDEASPDHASAIRTMNSLLEKAATYYEDKARLHFQKAERLRARIREA